MTVRLGRGPHRAGLMFGWLRRRPRPDAIPDALWTSVLARYPFLARRTPPERERLREIAAGFLSEKEFTGANGFVVTDEVALCIAAQAALPVLHLGLDWYGDFVGIVVHPSQVIAPRKAQDEGGVVHEWQEVIAGEAMVGGPVTLSWDDVRAGSVEGRAGTNVVIHEFVHKLDMRDGVANGCPPLAPGKLRRDWPGVMQAEFEAFREKAIVADRFGGEPTWLDPYAATAPAEFFAVAGEAYFVARERFGMEHPALLALFDRFFG